MASSTFYGIYLVILHLHLNTDWSVKSMSIPLDNTEMESHTEDDWYRCHGLPCDQWERVQRMMANISPGYAFDLEHTQTVEDEEEATDIWLTPEQATELLQEEERLRRHMRARRRTRESPLHRRIRDKRESQYRLQSVHHRVKRKIENFSERPEKKWNLPIVYKFDGSHDEEDRAIIRAAFAHWQEYTCLVFFELNEGAYVHGPHLKLTNVGSRCASFVGRADLPAGVPQQINLSTRCLNKFGTPVHEIGHALGLWHEHQRFDRDEHIYVVEANVGFWVRSNFYPAPARYVSSHDVPYDYNSVMHYSSMVGSVTGEDTIITLDPLYQNNIGQRVALSFLDAKVTNIAYCQAETRCKSSLGFGCLNGGYRDYNNCGQCICPPGLTGRRCETAAPSSGGFCGGRIELAVGGRVTISTPGYDNGLPYSTNLECNWLIVVPNNSRAVFTFEEDFSVYCSSRSCYHWVEVQADLTMDKPGPRFCCSDRPEARLVSLSNQMLVTFRSKYKVPDEQFGRGFKASIIAVEATSDGENQIEGIYDVDGSGEIPSSTRQAPELSWSEWGPCLGHACSCGACSSRKRYQLCDGEICTGENEKVEEEKCWRHCDRTDRMLFHVGKTYDVQCPLCCAGYEPNANGKCEKE